MTSSIQGQPHDRYALILYGSETGNSQEAAEQLGRITERLRFVTKVAEMNAVEISDLLNCSFVIFTLSTTGQGDIPANARIFWKSILRKRLPTNCLHHVQFTTFGLGNSSYVKYINRFNWAARKLHKRLEQLGAQEFYLRGEADEQHPEGVRVLEKYPLPDGFPPIPDSELLPPKWTLEVAEISEAAGSLGVAPHISSQSTSETGTVMDGPIKDSLCWKDPLPEGETEKIDRNLPPADVLPIPGSWVATVDLNVGLTPSDHWQNVRHIGLSVHKKIDYEPGDVVTIYPKNFPEDVENLLELMDWTVDADKPLTFNASATSYMDPSFSPLVHSLYTTKTPTLRSLLLHNLDITAIPRRFFFEVLAKFTDDPMHHTRLLEFCNPAFSDEFFDYTTRPRRSILEVLQDFPSVRLPWRWAPYIFPKLRGRQFSICSGGVLKRPCTSDTSDEDNTCIDICVAIVQYRTVLKKIRRGVCSRYLATLRPGTKVAITISKGTFPIEPSIAEKPLLLIAPGTGIAPMRSLIYERASWTTSAPRVPRDPSRSCVLIFGARNRTKDFLYGHDWKRPELDVQVHTAFSRDQKEKRYVQDVVREEAELVHASLVLHRGRVFVCGSSGNMPVQVREAIVDAIFNGAHRMDWNYTRDQAEEEVQTMEKEGRYVQETW